MTHLSWNCRGMAAAATITELKEVCRAYQPVVLFLMETRAPKERVERLKRTLKFKFAFCVEPMGLSGGLCLLWKEQVHLQIFSSSPNFIHSNISDPRGMFEYDCTFIYCNPKFQHRRNLWDRLAALNRDRSRPWCCIGDFNEMVSHFEKDGIRPFDHSRADLFREFLFTTGLMDLELKGNKFTWVSNPRNGRITREKLDRVMVNWSLRSCFPHGSAIALPIISSDHSPIIFQPSPKERSGVSFKYEAYWEEHPDCKNIVKEGWENGDEGNSAWGTFIARSKMCKRRLQRWNKVEFKRADLEIAVLKGELSGLLNQSDSFPDCNRIYYLQNQIKALWKREEIYWSQRSRVKWLNWGDRNSKFFHASTVQRRERNRIIRLSDGENGWIEGRDNIFAHILQHFEGIYTSDSQEISDEIRGCIPNCISANMNTLLLRPVSELEIKKVVDGLGALKAPGPDGLNGLFFQKNWETVKTDVIKVVLDFFEGGCLPSEVNETIVSLIPKIPMAESLNHLRPISCCNFIYKVISKIIVVRMKDLMGSVITPNQSAFVGGRLIQDNLIVAHEAFHALRKKDKGGERSHGH